MRLEAQAVAFAKRLKLRFTAPNRSRLCRLDLERASVDEHLFDILVGKKLREDRADRGACAVSYTHLDVYKRQQVQNRPPTFVLFTTGFLDPGYPRFIQRRLRERYGFEGSPIQLNMRIREKRERR